MPHVAVRVKWQTGRDVSCLVDRRKDKLPPHFSYAAGEQMVVISGKLRKGGWRMVVFGLLVLLGFPIMALAHDETKPEMPILTVSETGTVTHEPDTAFVAFGMETAGKSLAEAQKRNSAVMGKVMDRLRTLTDREGANSNLLLYGLPAISIIA